MCRTWTYLVAATLAVSGTALVLPTMAQTGNPGAAEQLGRKVDEMTGAKDKTTDAMPNKKAEDSVATDVRKTLARAINDAYTKDSFDDLVGYFSKADRDRIGKVSNQQNQDLNQKIADFRKAFKDKYNQDFDIKEDHLSSLMVYQGSDKDHVIAQLPGMQGEGAGLKKGETVSGGDAGKTEERVRGAMDKGMAEGKGAGLLTLNLINEGTILNAWRINVPDQLTADELRNSLSQHIGTLTSQKDSWPSDVSGAYRAAARHVFMSLSTPSIAIEK